MTREIFKLGFWLDYLKHVLMPRVDGVTCRVFGHGQKFFYYYQDGRPARICLRCGEEMVHMSTVATMQFAKSWKKGRKRRLDR